MFGAAPDLQGNLDAMAQLVPGLTVGPGGATAFGLDAGDNKTMLNGLSFGAADTPRDAVTKSRYTTSAWDPSVGGFSGFRIWSRSGEAATSARDRPLQSRPPGAPVLRPGRRAPRRGVHQHRRRRRRHRTDRAGEVLLQLRCATEAKHGGRVVALRPRPAITQRRGRVTRLSGATALDPLVPSRPRDDGRHPVGTRHDHRVVHRARGSPHASRRTRKRCPARRRM